MRSNMLFVSALTSALLIAMPAHAQVLGGGGLVGGVTGGLGGTVGHLGGSVGGSATGSLDGMGHLDRNTLHERERVERLERRAGAAQRRALQAGGNVTTQAAGLANGATGALDAQVRGQGATMTSGALDAEAAHLAGRAAGQGAGMLDVRREVRSMPSVDGSPATSPAPLHVARGLQNAVPSAAPVAVRAAGNAQAALAGDGNANARGNDALGSALDAGHAAHGKVASAAQAAGRMATGLPSKAMSSLPDARSAKGASLNGLGQGSAQADGDGNASGATALDAIASDDPTAPKRSGSTKPSTQAKAHAQGRAQAHAKADRDTGVSAHGDASGSAGANVSSRP